MAVATETDDMLLFPQLGDSCGDEICVPTEIVDLLLFTNGSTASVNMGDDGVDVVASTLLTTFNI